MNLTTDLPMHRIEGYTSRSQQARVATERWVAESLRCPACSSVMRELAANTLVNDFACAGCNERFQLKAKEGKFGRQITGAAYKPLQMSIQLGTNPSLILLQYLFFSKDWGVVTSVEAIYRKAVTEECVRARKPLSPSARRAGWQGCVILLDEISTIARINIFRSGEWSKQPDILAGWESAKKWFGS